MAQTATKEELDHRWRQLEPRWSNFHRRRDLEGTWAQLRRREKPVTLQHELSKAQEGMDFRSADLDYAVWMDKAILKQNPTTINYRLPGDSQASRDNESACAQFFRGGWEQTNIRRIWDDRVAEGQDKDGMKLERLGHRPFELPDDGEDLKFPFKMENCLLDGVYFNGGVFDPQDFLIYRYSCPITDSGVKKDGKRIYVNKQENKVDWLGPHEPYDYVNQAGESIHIIVIDEPASDGTMCPLEGCEHVQRYISTYVCLPGQTFLDSEKIETVASPYDRNSFFVIGGYVMQTERDPDNVYRPKLLPLYELINLLNWLYTLLAVLIRMEAKRNDYLNVGGTAADVLAQSYESEGGPKDTIDVPDPTDDSMAVYAGIVQRYPTATSAHLMPFIQVIKEEIQRHMPNPSLLGQNFVQQSNATASAVGLGTQAAGLPYEPLISESDGTIAAILHAERHAMLYWSYYAPDDQQPRWYLDIGSDPRKGQSGTRVYVDAKKLGAYPDINVVTGSKTSAQKAQDWALAKDKFAQGVMTVRDLIRESGVMDPEDYMEDLFADRIDQALDPTVINMAVRYLERQASIQSGIDFGQFSPEQQGLQPVGAQGSSSTAPHDPNPYAGAAQRQLAPPVSLPAIPSPEGGSSGLA